MALLPDDNEEFSLETRDDLPSHLLSKIKHFSMLTKHGISKLESMEFEAGDYKWKLIIYLDGDEVGEKVGHISVHLSVVGTSSLPADMDGTAIFNFFLYDQISDNYLCLRGKARRFKAINSEIRFSKAIDKKTFLDPSNGYVVDDYCVFGAEVFVAKNKRVIENLDLHDCSIPYKREWEIFELSDLEYGWSSEKFSTAGYNWKIFMPPNVTLRAKHRYVSISLCRLDSKRFPARTRMKATCVFYFISTFYDDKYHCVRVADWLWGSYEKLGFDDYKAVHATSCPNDARGRNRFILKIRLSIEAIQSVLS